MGAKCCFTYETKEWNSEIKCTIANSVTNLTRIPFLINRSRKSN